MQNKSLNFVLLLLIFVILFDWVFGKVYSALYFTEKSQNIDRLIHSAIGTNEDVLIFGSSRAYHHYNPLIIEDSLNLSCFNVGYGGQNIYYHLAILKSAIERKKPKIAILDLIYIDYEKTGNIHSKEKLGVLLPFVDKSQAMKEAVLSRGATERYKLWSSIYPFNSKQLYLIRNNLSAQRSDIKGFLPLDKVLTKEISKIDVKRIEIDSAKIESIFEFIDLCIKNQIKIFLFVSPHFVIQKGESNYKFLSNLIYDKYGFEILNFETATEFINDSKLFADPYHLNKEGADLYSKFVGNIINDSLNHGK
ncbi:MAG: hypothetical protein K9H61_02880 [Bacteroidia bacterium]|nr:hypothetical protein [Bacteroidia bacterium]MCF8445916.1 hypothetical protein [Bacteroidia bacterium]